MEIKNLVTAALIIFIVIVVGVLTASIFIKQPIKTPTTDQNSLTLAQIAIHNTSSDCWTIVNNKIYNVTNYIPLHPAGADKITPFCGKDATQAFSTRGGKGPHPKEAQDVLNTYYIGDLKQ